MSRRGRAAAANTADTETESKTVDSNHTTNLSAPMSKKSSRPKKQAQEEKAPPEQEQEEEEEEEKQPPTTPVRQAARSKPASSLSSPASHVSTPASRLSARPSTTSTLTSPASPAAEQHSKLLDVVDQLEKAKGGINTRILQQVFTVLTSYSPPESSGITGMSSIKPAKPSKIPPADRPFLNTIAKTLANRSILQHKSEEVRVLTGCCLADILRIYAPDAPYDPPTIKAIFQFFFSLLEHLSKPNTGVHYFYVLEALALVHSPLVLHTLPDHDAQSMTLQLVELLLNQLKLGIKHTGVEGYISQIVTSVIDEYHTELPSSFIDICLVLLAEPDVMQSLTGKFILDVIRSRQDTLEPYICKWIRDVFVVPAKKSAKEEQNRKKNTAGASVASSTQSSPKGEKQQKKQKKPKKKKTASDDEADMSDESDMDVDNADDDDNTGTTRIQDKVLQLNIFRNIHWYLPDLLLGIQGDLLDLLTIDHEPIRLQYTEVYLDIFTHTDRGRVVVKLLPALYESLLGRLMDVNKEVRKTIADRVGELMMKIYGKRGVDPQDQMVIDGVSDPHTGVLLDKSDGVSNGLSSSTHAHNISLAYVWELLTVSLMEKETDIRTSSLRSLSKATVYDPHLINLNLLEMMCARCWDKKYAVRKEAIIGLSHIFHHHVTKQWRQGQPLAKEQRKFTYIPSRLVAVSNSDHTTGLIVELCMDNNVIGMKENEGAPPSAQKRKGKTEGSSKVFSEEEYQRVLTERTRCLTAVYMALQAAEASSVSSTTATPFHDAVPEMLRLPVTPPSWSPEAKALHHFLNRFLVQKQSLHQAVRDCINQQQRIFTAKKQVLPTNSTSATSNKSNTIKELERTMLERIHALAQRLYSEEDADLFLPSSHSANINAAALHKARDQALELIIRLLKMVFSAENDTIHQCLYTLTDCHTTLQGFRQAHHDLIQAVTKLVLPDAHATAATDSKPSKATMTREQQQQKKLNGTVLMARLGWSCALTLFPSDSIPCFLAHAQQGMENPARLKMGLSAMDLLYHMCQSFPTIFPAESIETLYNIAQSKEADTHPFMLYALKILAGIDYFSVTLTRSMWW